jgi:AI-2E family transporter
LLGGLFRYIPYIGAPATALFPITLSLAQFDTWWPALIVIVLVVGLEVVISNFVEPRLYGQSIGVSEVALLIAAAFWAFLWGPVGLILSCPLTVCLVVLGKYVPHLEFLAVLLGDQPPLSDAATYYQRLAAKDHDEATQIVLTTVEKGAGDETYDALLLPALYYAARDRERGVFEEADECFIHRATREILEDLGEKQTKHDGDQIVAESVKTAASAAKKARVLGVPARDDADELALAMLGQLLDSDKWELQTVPFDELTAEVVELIEKEQPALICIASLPPGGLAHTRYLCKRLRSRFPRLHIVVGRWGSEEAGEDDREPILSAGADHVETTLLGMRTHLNGWLPALLAGDPANGVSHASPSESGRDEVRQTPIKNRQTVLAAK